MHTQCTGCVLAVQIKVYMPGGGGACVANMQGMTCEEDLVAKAASPNPPAMGKIRDGVSAMRTPLGVWLQQWCAGLWICRQSRYSIAKGKCPTSK